MHRILVGACAAFLGILPSAAYAGTGIGADQMGQLGGVPREFADLASPRELLVDVYFGGQKVGETRIVSRPGFVQFRDPVSVVGFIPNVMVPEKLTAALVRELPSNVDRLCADSLPKGCGILDPGDVGVIFDEDQFRLDIFVNPTLLGIAGLTKDAFLPTPTAPLSVTNAVGLALSGSGGSATYNVQNRSIIAFRNARIRSENSFASKFGFTIDNLVAEVDRPDLRYSAGLFWAPGLDLTGQRRILGFGVGTQFDTRADRDRMRGTPLVLFLPQAARVEMLIDGRLVDSGLYEAGNNAIDTSRLPDGSYAIRLRIQQMNGEYREERRFFVKNAQVAPLGRPLYFGYVGMLTKTRHGRPIGISQDAFFQFGHARRLSRSVAIDVTVIGTPKKPLLEAGAWLIAGPGRARIAGIASASGDYGALLQLTSFQSNRVSMSFDLRRIWSSDNRPLIPVLPQTHNSLTVSSTNNHHSEGSYTQINGSIGYRVGAAYLSLIGSLRSDRGRPTEYSVGPGIAWPVISRNGVQLTLSADAQLTRQVRSGFVGFRVAFNPGMFSTTSTAGRRIISEKNRRSTAKSRPVGGMTAQYTYTDAEQSALSVAGGFERDLENTRGHASAMVYSRLGSARAEINRTFEGSGRTQYSLTLQSIGVLNSKDVVWGGRNLEDSAIVVSVGGGPGQSAFEILVDEQPRGRVTTGERLPIFLQPYRRYKLRLRPVHAPSVWFETATREVTLYPGNVQRVEWNVERLVTVFGRARHVNGAPVSDARVTSRRGIGQSDADGYFQIETTRNETLSFSQSVGIGCSVNVGSLDLRNDFVRLGEVICR